MNKENSAKLWKLIQEAGDYLQGKLPDHPNHPKGRNSYAHVAICIRSKFKKSYKDIEDKNLQEVVDYIEYLKNKDYENAKKWFSEASSKQFLPAMVELGKIYRENRITNTCKPMQPMQTNATNANQCNQCKPVQTNAFLNYF